MALSINKSNHWIRFFILIIALAIPTASAQSQTPEEDPVCEYKAFLEQLPHEVGTIKNAVEEYFRSFPRRSVEQRDKAFILFYRFYYPTIDSISDAMFGDQERLKNLLEKDEFRAAV